MKRKTRRPVTKTDRSLLSRLACAALAVLLGLGIWAAAGCATSGNPPPMEVIEKIKSRPISYRQGYQDGWIDAGEGEHVRRNLERMTIDILYAQGYDDGWWDYREAHRSFAGKVLRRIAQ